MNEKNNSLLPFTVIDRRYNTGIKSPPTVLCEANSIDDMLKDMVLPSTVIVYVARDKELLIRDIIEQDYSIEEKTLRILSIDAEKRNRQICDYAVNNMDVGAATRELSDVLENNCL